MEGNIFKNRFMQFISNSFSTASWRHLDRSGWSVVFQRAKKSFDAGLESFFTFNIQLANHVRAGLHHRRAKSEHILFKT